MKKIAKKIVVQMLGWQIQRLQRKSDIKVVAVVGSIGKTSTKLAIARTLSAKYRVQYQVGNYNDLVTVPLIFFGITEPSLLNPFAWVKTFLRIEGQLRRKYPYDVVVLELGTDGPGQIAAFGQYLTVDLAVVTAIAEEHMEFFEDLDAVAKEEFSVVQYAKQLLVNYDQCPQEYVQAAAVPHKTYGFDKKADYVVQDYAVGRDGAKFTLKLDDKGELRAQHASIAALQLNALCAAGAVATELGMSPDEITTGYENVVPVNGRLQLLEGVKNSTIIDDTYNASPEAVKAAIETLYSMDAPQKIALLGNMNELGAYSKDAHESIGKLCDPKQLDYVITLGPDANTYLAPQAEDKGCRVKRCMSPYEAGEFISGIMKPEALILCKGSQNGVFAEEAVKILLADPTDSAKLVRQSTAWLKKKEESFK